MRDGNNLSGKVGLDTTDFKTNVAALNREIRVVESGFRASAAALGDWAKDATGLEQRISTLNRTIDLQGQKVANTRAEYERIKAEKGENSRAAQDLEIKLNKETETLNKMTNELGETEKNLAELSSGSNEAADSVENLGESSEGASGGLETLRNVAGGAWGALQVGLGVVMALAAAVAVLAGAIGGLVFSTANASAELVDLSAKTGISTTRLQELAYIGDQVGTSQETMVGSLARLTRTMGSAQQQQAEYAAAQAEAAAAGEEFDGQLGDAAAAFDRLGVSTTDASGGLRDNEAVFADTITALGQINNEAERDALAMSIFGKSAQELNPLIKAGTAEMARLGEEAHQVGAVMSDENVAAFEAFDDTLASLKAGLQGTLGTLAGAFLPGFQSVFDQAGGYLREFAGIVKNSDGDMGKIATGVTGLVQKIVTDLANQAPQYLQGGLSILTGILSAILTGLPAMLPVVLQMIQALVGFLLAALPQLMQAGVGILLTLVDGIITGLPGLITAALQMILTLLQGLTEAMPKLIPVIAEAIPMIVTTIVQNLPLIIQAAIALILALIAGIQQAAPQLMAALPGIIRAMYDAMIALGPILLQAGLDLLVLFGKGMWSGLPTLLSAVGGIVVEIFSGLYRGFETNMPKFLAQIKGFFGGIVTAAKSALGIKSPSRLFADQVGAQIPSGIGQGILGAMPALERDLGAAMRGLAGSSYEINASLRPGALAGAGLAGGGGISIGDIYVDARGAKDPQAVGQTVGESVLSRLRARGAA